MFLVIVRGRGTWRAEGDYDNLTVAESKVRELTRSGRAAMIFVEYTGSNVQANGADVHREIPASPLNLGNPVPVPPVKQEPHKDKAKAAGS